MNRCGSTVECRLEKVGHNHWRCSVCGSDVRMPANVQVLKVTSKCLAGLPGWKTGTEAVMSPQGD